MYAKPGLLLIALVFPILSAAQSPLSPENVRRFSRVFDNDLRGGRLNCHLEPVKPFLDFAFRFEIGYVVRCPVRQFEGKQATLGALLRVTPHGSPPVTLGQHFEIPAIPPDARPRVDFKHLATEFEFSGVFAAGEGEYPVEIAVFDDHNRIFHKRWQETTCLHGDEEKAPLTIARDTAEAISLPPWSGPSSGGRGLRLTVLLNAAPVNPYSFTIRAWDRAFLLGSLSSLLRRLPVASVRLIAFNLEQQRELFREDAFDRQGLGRLANSLASLELATVSLKTLQNQTGWSQLLTNLVDYEEAAEDHADAVVFLGPHNRNDREIPPEMLNGAGNLPLYYFEYFPRYGRDFPDAIQRLTSARNGVTLKLHSPGELAGAIAKMQKLLKKNRTVLSASE